MAHSPLDPIRAHAEQYPEWEKAFLFGDHEVYRVNKKVYLWLGETESGGTYVSVKLKDSQSAALMLPFVKPAAYGMAKWGWVRAEFPRGPIPAGLVKEWIRESYRHTAPMKLLKVLDGEAKPKLKPGTGVALRAKKSAAAKKPALRAARR